MTRGFLCYRTNQFLGTQYSPDRVVTPLLRRGNGDDFVAVSWGDAGSMIAGKLRAILRGAGPAAVFPYRSGGSPRLLKEPGAHFFPEPRPGTQKRGDILPRAGEAA